MNIIYYYILGALITSNLITIWKLTNISVKFFKIFKKQNNIYTTEDLEDHLAIKGGWLGELLICPLCLSTHISWVVGLLIHLLTGCSPLIILCGMFSWPLLSYLFLVVLKKLS